MVLTHHSLENDFLGRGICNRKEVQSIVNRVNIFNKKVILCINGHDHGCGTTRIVVTGMNGEYDNMSPKDLGVGEIWNGRSILPRITSV